MNRTVFFFPLRHQIFQKNSRKPNNKKKALLYSFNPASPFWSRLNLTTHFGKNLHPSFWENIYSSLGLNEVPLICSCVHTIISNRFETPWSRSNISIQINCSHYRHFNPLLKVNWVNRFDSLQIEIVWMAQSDSTLKWIEFAHAPRRWFLATYFLFIAVGEACSVFCSMLLSWLCWFSTVFY
jgi:hypothetical protein